MRNEWIRADQQAFLELLEDLFPGSTQRAGKIRNESNREWLHLLAPYPARLSMQALRDHRHETQSDREPTMTAIATRTRDLYRGLQRHLTSRSDQGAPMTPQEFATDPSLEDWWRERENHPDPRMRETYRRIRQRLFDGKMPTILQPRTEPKTAPEGQEGPSGRSEGPSESPPAGDPGKSSTRQPGDPGAQLGDPSCPI